MLALLLAPTLSAASAPEAVVDDLGDTVQLASEPLRIVSLAPNNTELLYALGLGDRVVGVTRYCNYPAAATQVEQVAGFADLSLEKIATVRPDLVLASRGNDPEALDSVRQLGVPVFGLANNSVAQVIDSVRRLGRLTGRQQAATKLAAALEARVERVRQKVVARPAAERPRVLWGFVGDPIYTAGEGTIIDDVIRVAGGINIGRQAGPGWPQVSLEAVVDWQAEVLLTSLHLDGAVVDDGAVATAVAVELGRMRQLTGWQQLPAVQQGRLVHIDADVLTRAGPRIIDAVEQLSAALFPVASPPPGVPE